MTTKQSAREEAIDEGIKTAKEKVEAITKKEEK